MNVHDFEEPINISDNVKQPDQGANGPVLNPDSFTDKAPQDAALIHEVPMEETMAAVGPMDETKVQDSPKGEMVTHETPLPMNAGSLAALLSREESEPFRKRWIEIQGMFVDEPRSAVQQADALVSEVLKKIIQMFASEHSSLEGQWNQGIDVSTEDLRKALQHYRSFFNRLVV